MSIIPEEKTLVPDVVAPVADEEINAMLKAGLHIGHVPAKTHPKMAQFIFANHGGIAIFDLVKTKEKLATSAAFVKKTIADKKTILFVGTKPAAQAIIKKLNETYGIPVVTERWVGGTLTNWKVILGRIQELDRLQQEKAEGGFKKYTKKEAVRKEEAILRLEKTFGGLKGLKRIPDVIMVADADEDELAIRETKRMRIPTIAIVNSNRNPEAVQFAIPANDNSIPSVTYIIGKLEEAIQAGQKEISKALIDGAASDK